MSTPPTPSRTWTKTAQRPLRSRRKSLAVWAMARFMGVAVPWQAVRQTDGAALLAHEHERLQALAAAGERVPPVLSFDGQQLVTGDIGSTLDHQLRDLPAAAALDLMCAAATDLARFHAHGHWHGGAQSRNITWDGHRFARLDFEEQLYPALPLATVQAYDVLQLVLSLARVLEPMGPQAVCAVWRAYEQGRSPVRLRPFLQRLLPRLGWVLRGLGCSSRLRSSREARVVRTVLEGSRQFLASSPD
ncbi:MAG TPA: hypothetical protein VFY31_02895 [Macromonas sp.]|nr:hypothetical protein [Macromonas sp.]